MIVVKWLFIFHLLSSSSYARNLLMIGDSVDRYIVTEWCDAAVTSGLPISRGLVGENLLKYAPHKMGAYYCRSHATNVSLWFFHVFGSNTTGPYRYSTNGTMTPEYVDVDGQENTFPINTPSRIRGAMDLFYGMFSPSQYPDVIYFNSVLWDLVLLRQVHNDSSSSSSRNNMLTWFKRNLHMRLNEIAVHARYLAKRTGTTPPLLGLKTVLTNPWGFTAYNVEALQQSVFAAFNKELARTAKERQLEFFDFERDSWSTVRWDHNRSAELFRDDTHQNAIHSVRAADKLLGIAYSRYYASYQQGNTKDKDGKSKVDKSQTIMKNSKQQQGQSKESCLSTARFVTTRRSDSDVCVSNPPNSGKEVMVDISGIDVFLLAPNNANDAHPVVRLGPVTAYFVD